MTRDRKFAAVWGLTGGAVFAFLYSLAGHTVPAVAILLIGPVVTVAVHELAGRSSI